MIQSIRKYEIPPLRLFANYAKIKGMSRMWVHRLVHETNELDGLLIDGVGYVIMNMKAVNYKKKRKSPR